jgi:hypothetical protein
LLKTDESTHIDELVELLEAEVSAPEIFAAMFELGAGRENTATAGEEFCKKLFAVSTWLLAENSRGIHEEL